MEKLLRFRNPCSTHTHTPWSLSDGKARKVEDSKDGAFASFVRFVLASEERTPTRLLSCPLPTPPPHAPPLPVNPPPLPPVLPFLLSPQAFRRSKNAARRREQGTGKYQSTRKPSGRKTSRRLKTLLPAKLRRSGRTALLGPPLRPPAPVPFLLPQQHTPQTHPRTPINEKKIHDGIHQGCNGDQDALMLMSLTTPHSTKN